MARECGLFLTATFLKPGNKEPFGHESLVILNMNDKDINIEFDIYFNKAEPVKNISSVTKAQRVRCFRLDSLLVNRIIRSHLVSMLWWFAVGCPDRADGCNPA
jgi:hypothetical protein